MDEVNRITQLLRERTSKKRQALLSLTLFQEAALVDQLFNVFDLRGPPTQKVEFSSFEKLYFEIAQRVFYQNLCSSHQNSTAWMTNFPIFWKSQILTKQKNSTRCRLKLIKF